MIRTLLTLVCASVLLRGGDSLAIVIGISEYAHLNGGNSPKYARGDASDFARYNSTPDESTVSTSNTRLLTDSKATRSAIESALGWLSSRSTYQDQIFLYFSGRVGADSKGQLYILPWEAEQDLSSAIGIDEVVGYLRRRVRARQVSLFLEAYRGGEVQVVARSGIQRTLELPDRSDGPAELPAAGVAPAMVFLASSPDEQLHEDHLVGRGVFTLYLLEGLRGKADQDLDGVVSTGELRRYVVDAMAYHTDGQQHPVMLPGFQPGVGLTRSRVGQPAAGDLTAEEAAAVRKQSRKDDQAEVFFAANSDVAAAGVSSVVRLAKLLKRNPDDRCVLEGHADVSETSPVLRSRRRALSIRTLLLELGVKPEQIATEPLGVSQPKSASASEAGKLVNRRVTAKVHTSHVYSYVPPVVEGVVGLENAEAGSTKAIVEEYFPQGRLRQMLNVRAFQWDDVFFASNSSAVVTGIPRLLQLSDILKEDHNLKCTVTGYADITDNSWDELSLKRAAAVREFLLENGVPADRVTTAAGRLANPVAPSLYDTGRLLNRRVTIDVTARPSKP